MRILLKYDIPFSHQNPKIDNIYIMKFKAKLRKIGNSIGILIPREEIEGYNIGDEIVITIGEVITEKKEDVITIPIVGTVDSKTEKVHFNTSWCQKHSVMKGTCGCS